MFNIFLAQKLRVTNIWRNGGLDHLTPLTAVKIANSNAKKIYLKLLDKNFQKPPLNSMYDLYSLYVTCKSKHKISKKKKTVFNDLFHAENGI